MRKKHGKTSVRLVEKCPDIPVAVVQYIFRLPFYHHVTFLVILEITTNNSQNFRSPKQIRGRQKKKDSYAL
jgi:uncharacterized membrane protein